MCGTLARRAATPVMKTSSTQKKSVPSADISLLAADGVVMYIMLHNEFQTFKINPF